MKARGRVRRAPERESSAEAQCPGCAPAERRHFLSGTMRTHTQSFLIALLLRAVICTSFLRERFPSCTSSVSTLESYRATEDEAARVRKLRGTSAGSRWSAWQELAGGARVVLLEPGCGRNTNRLATLSDGSRACVRYGVDQDQVLGETLCYHLAILLGINNVLPLALTKPDPSSQQWSVVRDSIEALNWSSDAIVSLTQWVPSAHRVPIPVQFRRARGVCPASWTLENMSSSDLRDFMQWTDLVLFDYLTANFDRIASHLFSLQWDRRAMERPTNNLLRTTKGRLLFIDNEAGLIHGYRVLDHWEHLHQTLLNSTCMFRERTVQRLAELTRSRSAAQQLRRVYQAREPFARELGFLSEAQMATLQNRVDTLYRHFQQCCKHVI